MLSSSHSFEARAHTHRVGLLWCSGPSSVLKKKSNTVGGALCFRRAPRHVKMLQSSESRGPSRRPCLAYIKYPVCYSSVHVTHMNPQHPLVNMHRTPHAAGFKRETLFRLDSFSRTASIPPRVGFQIPQHHPGPSPRLIRPFPIKNKNAEG